MSYAILRLGEATDRIISATMADTLPASDSSNLES